MHCLRAVWVWIAEWAPYALPALANGVLVFLGVWLSLPDFAQKVQDNPTYRKLLAGICVALGVIGMISEVRARHDSDKTNKQLLGSVSSALVNTNNLVTTTTTLITTSNSLIGNTNEMVSHLRLLEPQILEDTNRLQKIDRAMEDAKKENDSKQVAALEAEKQRSLSDLLRMASGIDAAMVDWTQKWMLNDRSLEHQIDDAKQHLPAEAAKLADLQRARSDADRDYTREIQPIIRSANYLREKLLQGTTPTEADEKSAKILTDVLQGRPINWMEMGQATSYIERLIRKVTAPQAPIGLEAVTK